MMNPADFKILISDDSSLIRKKLKDYLFMLGYTNIIEATNGEEAICAFQEHSPSLVFMDIVMPEVTGIEAVRRIKEFSADATIVMISTTGTRANINDAIKAGAKDFIMKPFTHSQIRAVLQKLNP